MKCDFSLHLLNLYTWKKLFGSSLDVPKTHMSTCTLMLWMIYGYMASIACHGAKLYLHFSLFFFFISLCALIFTESRRTKIQYAQMHIVLQRYSHRGTIQERLQVLNASIKGPCTHFCHAHEPFDIRVCSHAGHLRKCKTISHAKTTRLC